MTNKEYFYYTLYQVLSDDGILYLEFIPVADYKFLTTFNQEMGCYPIEKILFNKKIDFTITNSADIELANIIKGKFNVNNIFNSVLNADIGISGSIMFAFDESSGLKNKYIVVGGIANAKDFKFNNKTKFNVNESISFYVKNGNSFEINWSTELSNAYESNMSVANAINTLFNHQITLTDTSSVEAVLGSEVEFEISLTNSFVNNFNIEVDSVGVKKIKINYRAILDDSFISNFRVYIDAILNDFAGKTLSQMSGTLNDLSRKYI